MLNAMVDEAPQEYLHPQTGRPSRYPSHDLKTYPTDESSEDEGLADEIKREASHLRGLKLLGSHIFVPASSRQQHSDESWLRLRMESAAGLAGYHVRAAMRSSRAALVEHLCGTAYAVERYKLTTLTKPQVSGDMVQTMRDCADGLPPVVDLTCDLPEWLSDPAAWRRACLQEMQRYQRILNLAERLSDRRERAKANLVRKLTEGHERVLGFDQHPITLAALQQMLDLGDVPVYAATGATASARKQVKERFARESSQPGVALCSDAMNEGINLQGASVLVHFDMPTTLRIAEQRVGRVDRMDSPYERIEVWWPADGPSFATRADDMLQARNDESASLLGSNLTIPRRAGETNAVIDAQDFAHADRDVAWDGLRDALEPVRALVSGTDAVVPASAYEDQRTSSHRVLARISAVRSSRPWAFFAIRGTTTGAPRWMLLEDAGVEPLTDLNLVTRRLRTLLQEDPPGRDFDESCARALDGFLQRATRAEVQLLPRISQRALAQMQAMCRRWEHAANAASSYDMAKRWSVLAGLAVPDEEGVCADPYQIATAWLRLVQPIRLDVRSRRRRRRYSRLADINKVLQAAPLPVSEVEQAMVGLQLMEPLDRRVSACILSVPD
jgi:hypothetical protein